MGQPIRLAVGVQHHPSRASLLPALLKALAPLPVDVAADPNPEGPPFAWRSYRQALEQTPDWATHRLVIQDDAAPCAQFADVASRALAARSAWPLLLFHGHEPVAGAQAIARARAAGLPWAVANIGSFLPTVAIVWPATIAAQLLAWADRVQPDEGFVGDDWIAARFCREHGIQCLVTVPSLVEHPDQVSSVAQLNYSGPPRSSCAPSVGVDIDVIDWAKGSV